MNSLPPLFTSESFNSNAFTNGDVLSLRIGDSRYLKLTGGTITGTLTVSSSLTVAGLSNFSNTINQTMTTGDLLKLTATDNNSRSTILFTTPSNSLELGIRGPAAGIYPSTYYRFSNGSFKYIMDLANGNTQQFGQAVIETNGSHLTLKNGAEWSLIEHGLSSLRISSSVCPALLSLTSIGVNIASNGNHLTLRNGASTAFLEITSGDQLRLVRGYAMNLNSTGLRLQSTSTADARTALDLGQQVGDKVIIFNEPQNSGGDVYSIGCNNLNMIYSSGGGHRFVKSNASPVVNSSDLASIDGNGVLRVSNNTVMTKGWFCPNSSFSNPSARVGIGLACHMANSSFAEFFTWDYTNSLWKDLKINNTMYVNGTNSFVQIGANPGNPIYPLAVSGNFTTSFAGSYGYLNSSGAGSGSSTGSVPVTCFLQHRLWCSEVNAFSDRRLKENFSEVSTDDAIDFIKTVKAKNYNWKADKTKKQCTGYVAQDILKFGKFNDLVALGPDEDLEEEIDEDGFKNPAKHRFLVSYQSAVPILHAAISQLIERIEALEEAANKPKRVRKKKDD